MSFPQLESWLQQWPTLSFVILFLLFSSVVWIAVKFSGRLILHYRLVEKEYVKLLRKPFAFFIITLSAYLSEFQMKTVGSSLVRHLILLSIIFSIALLLIRLFSAFRTLVMSQHDLTHADNLHARKAYTQVKVFENIFRVIIVVLAIGIALTTFDSIKEVGTSLLTSAGVAGIIIGLAAQRIIATMLAGFQIAITQPIRIDDVVIVEKEWGRIEEINLTYVVVNIWDKRRLVLPTTYFIEKPFQNWTRTTSEILGIVFIHTDYHLPVEVLRPALTNILHQTDLWDGKVNVVQVTEAKESCVEIRILVSAKDSPTAWDLRVLVREKLIDFLQKNYPECLPYTRVALRDQRETAE